MQKNTTKNKRYMKKFFLFIFALLSVVFTYAQSAQDLFSGNTQINWLGIDFSNVRLIGDFSQFSGAGEKNPSQIKRIYFPAWNKLILDEREKYDVAGMLRKDKVFYDIDMVMDLNSNASLDEMETYNAPVYAREDIEKFVTKYKTGGKEGVGVVLIAESLNKAEKEAWFHFVAIDMGSKKILVHDRIRGEPSGIGLRNYWAGAIHDVIKDINKNRYRNWKSDYAKR
jgi:hypothetical protein